MKHLFLLIVISLFFGCKANENKEVAKKDTVVHNFTMKVDTTHYVPDILIGSGGFSLYDSSGKLIDSAWNDKNDSFGSDHYYFFGSKKVPQKGVAQMVKRVESNIYECETFINGYMAYWVVFSGNKIDSGRNKEVIDRYNASQKPQSKTVVTNTQINHANTVNIGN